MLDLINPLTIRRYEKAEHLICFCSSILSLGIRANSNGAKDGKAGFPCASQKPDAKTAEKTIDRPSTIQGRTDTCRHGSHHLGGP